MKKSEILKRYIFFLAGLFVNSFGVSFVTKASLGTSPISSIPYTLSIGFKPSLGLFTLYFSILLIIIQILLLRSKFPKEYLLQIPVSIIFSYFIDFTMNLLSFMKPDTYLLKFASLLIGCAILGIGVFMEIVADVVMLPGESFVKAVSVTFHTDFGKTKMAFDSSMTLIAGIIGLILYHKLAGVREGTVIAAILVGMIARTLKRKIGFIEKYLCSANGMKVQSTSNENTLLEDKNIIITISREYGSGGCAIAERLASEIGFTYYDRDIIKMAAKENHLDEAYVEAKEQKMTNSFLFDLVAQYQSYENEKTPQDILYEAEKKIIQRIAENGNCVIVGRCADYILKDYKNCYNVFLFASREFKINQIMLRENMNAPGAQDKVKNVNRKRFHHYKYYTGQIWGMAQNYNLCIDTGMFGIEDTVEMIKGLVKKAT